jgi:hypothetical protein
MLHFESVETSTLELIKSLQDKEYLKGFYLVGGTALALYTGHRKSVDIDLFSNFSFDTARLLENIHQDYAYQLTFTSANTLKGNIGDIKADFLAHRYGYIDEPQTISGIKLISVPDIAAMKLNAISTSGQRSKDFIDIYYLLKQYSVGNLLGFYRNKYNQQNDTFVLKSLIYFDDADLTDWPVLLTDPGLNWNDVRKKIEKDVLAYVKKSI